MKNYLFAILLVFLACSENHDSIITFPVDTSDYTVSVSAQGILEAKQSRQIIVPHIWGHPEISFLEKEGTRVHQGDVIIRFEASDMQNRYIHLMDEISIAQADAAKKESELRMQVFMYTSQMHTAEASAKSAQLQLDKLQFEAPSVREKKRLEIQQFELEAEQARKKLETLKKIQKEERAHWQAKLRQIQTQLDRIKMMLDQLTVKAPIDGILVHEINWRTDDKVKEGDALHPGWPVVSIPDLRFMLLDLQVDETRAQMLWEGQRARVVVPSIGNQIFPAHVLKVDRIAKPVERGSRVKKVDVKVEIDSRNPELIPGLSATCRIIVKEIKNVIAVPKETVFVRDSLDVVYIKRGKEFSVVPIAVLLRDEDYCIIHGGIQNGDHLALEKPSSSAVKRSVTTSSAIPPVWADTLRIEKPKVETDPFRNAKFQPESSKTVLTEIY